MKNVTKKVGNFFNRLHKDESAPNTVEWVLLVVVALIVMVAIYYIAQWVLGSGADEAEKVNTGRDDTNKKVEAFKDLAK